MCCQASLSVGIVVVAYIVHQKKQPFVVPLHMRETTMKSLVKTAFPTGKTGAARSTLLDDAKPTPGASVAKSRRRTAGVGKASDKTASDARGGSSGNGGESSETANPVGGGTDVVKSESSLESAHSTGASTDGGRKPPGPGGDDADSDRYIFCLEYGYFRVSVIGWRRVCCQ